MSRQGRRIVLGIDTSGAVGGLALSDSGRILEERFLSRHATGQGRRLIPEAVVLLARHGLRLAELQGVAVSIGPGSFTGLRVGVTFAKTLAYAAGVPLVAVETFRAIAEQQTTAAVLVLADAQRRGVIAGWYERAEQWAMRRVGELELLHPEEVARRLTPGLLLAGEGTTRLTGLFHEAVPTGVSIAEPWRSRCRAATITRLGAADLQAGITTDPYPLEPLYIRRSGAEENAAPRNG